MYTFLNTTQFFPAMPPTIETTVGEGYLDSQNIAGKAPSGPPNQPVLYIGADEHSPEEVLASWSGKGIESMLRRYCALGTENTWTDLIAKPTKWELGNYRLPGEVFALQDIGKRAEMALNPKFRRLIIKY